jgi:hypothetical protein
MKRFAMCLMGLHLALVPCFADVIPSRRTEANPTAEQALKARLQQVGMTSTDADRHIGDLSPQEMAYFGQNPERVQVAGSLYWYEWVGGAVVAVVVVVLLLVPPFKVTSN